MQAILLEGVSTRYYTSVEKLISEICGAWSARCAEYYCPRPALKDCATVYDVRPAMTRTIY